ncbi:hypothetical protein [Dendronalium sp. ChiSLP03b]|nr:hypothetical protein [Dendronalium sp. ChiSLP03b]
MNMRIFANLSGDRSLLWSLTENSTLVLLISQNLSLTANGF